LYCFKSVLSEVTTSLERPQITHSHSFSSPWVMRTWVPVIRKLWLLHCHTVTNAALLPGTLDICRQKDHKPWSSHPFVVRRSANFVASPRHSLHWECLGRSLDLAASPRHSLHWECLGRSLDFVASPSQSLQCFTLGVFRTPASLHLEGGGGKPSL
jgi:hypothetical protein